MVMCHLFIYLAVLEPPPPPAPPHGTLYFKSYSFTVLKVHPANPLTNLHYLHYLQDKGQTP